MNIVPDSYFWRTRSNGNRVKCAMFECACGKRVGLIVYRGYQQKSCGCQRVLRGKANNMYRHGWYGHPLYICWAHMKQRCLNPKATGYQNYGGKGISICDEWLAFVPFKDWAISHGWQNGLEIERKDSNGNYTPSNCTFTDDKGQARNRPNFVRLNLRSVKRIRAALSKGQKPKQLASKFGVSADMISKIKCNHNWL